jgi:hypothetical protein
MPVTLVSILEAAARTKSAAHAGRADSHPAR